MAKNQLHAEKAQAQPHAASVKRVQQRIRLLDRQEKEIKVELANMVTEDSQASESVKLLRSIPGVGLLTAASVLAETNSFELIRNKCQLTSYAGLDVVEKQSGTSVRGKPKISKRGNRFLRKAMHMPALTAIRHDALFKGVFVRLVSKHGVKMKAVVAVQRKLLEMMYTVHSTGVAYDRKYLEKQQKRQQEASSDVQ
ncbi:transposase [Persicitalea sp.]|uniref:transposase n=1 Tax=Persicitalea sp. TaxID=3100273 RepID=UPI003593364A